MQGIKDGKIASTRIDGVVFTVNIQPAGGKPDKLTGKLADIAGYDIDTHAVAAIFDPQKSNDDQYYRAYRQITTGPYVVTSGQGAPGPSLNMRIDGMTIDDVGVRPSRMQLQDLLAMIPPPGGRAADTGAGARDAREGRQGVRGHPDRQMPRCAAFRSRRRRARSNSRRCASISIAARSANSRSKASMAARRKGPSSSGASRSNPSTSPT